MIGQVRARRALAYPVASPPALVATALAVALTLGVALTALGPSSGLLAMGALIVLAMAVLRWDELMVAIIVIASVLIDWYRLVDSSLLRFAIAAPLLASLLIALMLLSRDASRPWASIPSLWLWAMLLVLAVPAVVGVIPAYLPESLVFYAIGVLVTPFLMYIVGIQVGRSITSLRAVLALLSGFGTLVAAHTVFAAVTGTFLLETQHQSDYLTARGGFVFADSGTSRVGSFLLNPDWNGTFLLMVGLITVGLLIEDTSRIARAIYLVELALIVSALLFTYSLAAMGAAVIGLLVLVPLHTQRRHLIWPLVLVCAAVAVAALAFPPELGVLQQHASNPRELAFRLGAWLTALGVIAAYPLTGVGLSQWTYLQRAEPYRAPTQFIPLGHPHGSYLEVAAMGGLPLAIVFVALLGKVMWRALRTCRRTDARHRPPVAGAFAAVVGLTVNSLAINGWTLPPLAALGWLLLGLLSSPEAPDPQPARRPAERSPGRYADSWTAGGRARGLES